VVAVSADGTPPRITTGTEISVIEMYVRKAVGAGGMVVLVPQVRWPAS
jgi:hypothetical protein